MSAAWLASEATATNLYWVGTAAGNWLNQTDWDFTLIAGDDYTDEDMFNAGDEKAFTIHIGLAPSKAQYHTPDVGSFREFLVELSKSNDK